MTKADYDAALALWRSSDGVVLNESDSREAFAQFLERNPGLSLVARARNQIVATVLCGHDGRRGYLHHLVVASAYRRNSVATRLVTQCLARLHALHIPKCNIFLLRDNAEGRLFWERNGWSRREDLEMRQCRTASPASENQPASRT